MSQTERDAIDAGTVWFEADLFRGNPDWGKLLTYPQARLTDEEQAFVDGPTNELCAMMDDWEITYAAWWFPKNMVAWDSRVWVIRRS